MYDYNRGGWVILEHYGNAVISETAKFKEDIGIEKSVQNHFKVSLIHT